MSEKDRPQELSREQLANHYLTMAQKALANANAAATPSIREQYILLSEGWIALAKETGALTPP